jgi:polysaccharide biosynthesis protein PslG
MAAAVSKIASIIACIVLLFAGRTSAQNYHYGMNTQLDLQALSVPMADKLAELGAGILRIPFGWDVIEPRCKGCFDWTVTDAWRDQARRTHRTILATLGYTPQWANGGRHYSYPPTYDQDWYDFVFAVVSRYRDDIVLWGIWNEPNLDTYLHGSDLKVYQTLVLTASAAVRAANPDARVLGPEVSHHGLQDGWYAAAMTAFGEKFDIVTVHWYPDGPPLEIAMDELVRPRALGKNVWLTEVGARPCATMYGESGQALFYHQVLSAFLARRTWWTAVLFYDLYERPSPIDCGSAIVRPDWSNRPAFSLLQTVIRATP